MKKEKLYYNYTDGGIRGYKINNKYLLKHYTWGNKYNWIIADKDYYSIMESEIGNLYDEGKIEFVESLKEGISKIENKEVD